LVDAAHKLGMYVILDIVLNHTGDVFAYACDPGETDCTSQNGSQADFRPLARVVEWRDAQGKPHPEWPDIATVPNPTSDELVWPVEL
jgi:glycosidase